MKGFIDDNVTMDGKSGSDEELVELTTITKDVKLISVEAKDNKTKPGGGFFKYLNKTKFDFRKCGVFLKDRPKGL